MPLVTGAAPVVIPAGDFTSPVLLERERRTVPVAAFKLDSAPVSEAQFAGFVAANPGWQRDRVPAIFHDGGYLRHWSSPSTPGQDEDRPVTRVSWFAARAYCDAQGGQLPTLEQWEYALAHLRARAQITDDAYARLVFAWYNQTPLVERHQTAIDTLGMLGQVNEWLEDYQLLLSNGEQIDFGGGSCGDTARLLASYDAAHYATFLRYQSRSGYTPVTTTSTLGFRCAYPLESAL
ncbi:formylglycine-generating enzyme family protein [Marinimicrobium alkaliphilum]|uniref:formylglycine-generating enzyme family protein n=1 Tax=Marinimicrobium alkaliphilum TaxID=2202654 RepID=UPI0018E08ACD|nr:formylglycine-generating enzyme family protein [Marinimicrobium alkaliphilum]